VFDSPSVLVAALSIIAVAIAAKIVPAPLLMLRRLSLRDSLGSGVLLAGQLSVIIALAEVGVQIGIIGDGIAAGAVLLVGVTALASPVVFRVLSPARTTSDTGSPT
jgi:Kef-type K+ transport system membrane component KefB